ncbi:hypothetical protein PR048_022166 [Dryococelus australis]|uniref:C2H2-type domain-containing protein n=1 Tax=Dryococelus australis TaxID=614101 RepID=A0ABQ9H084_9NEOP|nr:hypothetical protein PR048_022166 [Dryococelus australis]
MVEDLPSVTLTASSTAMDPGDSLHTSQKQCYYCGNTFSKSSHARWHESSHCMFSPAYETFYCDNWGTLFTRSDNLYRHNQKCKDNTFTNSRNVRRHEDSNCPFVIAYKSYPCDNCGVVYANKCNLNAHSRNRSTKTDIIILLVELWEQASHLIGYYMLRKVSYWLGCQLASRLPGADWLTTFQRFAGELCQFASICGMIPRYKWLFHLCVSMTCWLDSTVLCTPEPQMFVQWLLSQRVANVTPPLAVWHLLLVSLSPPYCCETAAPALHTEQEKLLSACTHSMELANVIRKYPTALRTSFGNWNTRHSASARAPSVVHGSQWNTLEAVTQLKTLTFTLPFDFTHEFRSRNASFASVFTSAPWPGRSSRKWAGSGCSDAAGWLCNLRDLFAGSAPLVARHRRSLQDRPAALQPAIEQRATRRLHALDNSEPISDWKGNKYRIPYCQAWSNTGYSLGKQRMDTQLRLEYTQD